MSGHFDMLPCGTPVRDGTGSIWIVGATAGSFAADDVVFVMRTLLVPRFKFVDEWAVEQPGAIDRSTDQDEAAGATDGLWCLHMEGPDDVHPAPSKAHAEAAALLFNASAVAERAVECDVLLRAVAKPWPYDAVSHAESVGEFLENWIVPEHISLDAACYRTLLAVSDEDLGKPGVPCIAVPTSAEPQQGNYLNGVEAAAAVIAFAGQREVR